MHTFFVNFYGDGDHNLTVKRCLVILPQTSRSSTVTLGDFTQHGTHSHFTPCRATDKACECSTWTLKKIYDFSTLQA